MTQINDSILPCNAINKRSYNIQSEKIHQNTNNRKNAQSLKHRQMLFQQVTKFYCNLTGVESSHHDFANVQLQNDCVLCDQIYVVYILSSIQHKMLCFVSYRKSFSLHLFNSHVLKDIPQDDKGIPFNKLMIMFTASDISRHFKITSLR